MNTYINETDLLIVLKWASDICWYSPSMCLDEVASKLYTDYNVDATWKSKSIYVNNDRLLTIEFSHEGRNCWAIYQVKIAGGKTYDSSILCESICRLKPALLEDEETLWEVTFHLPQLNTGDSWELDDKQFTKIQFNGVTKEDIEKYAQQYIRVQQKASSHGDIWMGAEIVSIDKKEV